MSAPAEREFQVVYHKPDKRGDLGEVLTVSGVMGDSAESVKADFIGAGYAVVRVALAREVLSLCAKDDLEAAAVLGLKGRTTIWKLLNLPANDPRRIQRTSYGKIAFSELARHLKAELAAT